MIAVDTTRPVGPPGLPRRLRNGHAIPDTAHPRRPFRAHTSTAPRQLAGPQLSWLLAALLTGLVAVAVALPAHAAASKSGLADAVNAARSGASVATVAVDGGGTAQCAADKYADTGVAHPPGCDWGVGTWGEISLRDGGGDMSSQQAIDAWLDSPGHRDIMLDGVYTHIRVGLTVRSGEQFMVIQFARVEGSDPDPEPSPPPDPEPSPSPPPDADPPPESEPDPTSGDEDDEDDQDDQDDSDDEADEQEVEERRRVQRRLRELGYYDGPIDGILGAGSERAVRAFQAANDLEVDGVVGPNTAGVLFSDDAVTAEEAATAAASESATEPETTPSAGEQPTAATAREATPSAATNSTASPSSERTESEPSPSIGDEPSSPESSSSLPGILLGLAAVVLAAAGYFIMRK